MIMNIYKQATAFTFKDSAAVERLLKAKVDNLKSRGKDNIQEVLVYISSLSDIHSDATMAFEEDLKADPKSIIVKSTNNVVGGYFAKDFIAFIEAIGPENFLLAEDFGPAATKLREIAASYFGPAAQQQVSLQNSEDQAEEVIERSDDGAEGYTAPDSEVLFRQVEALPSLSAKVQMVFDFNAEEKIAYTDFLMGHDFCDNNVMKILYNNFISMVEDYEERKSPGLALDIKDAIREIIERFQNLRDGVEEDDIDEGRDDVEVSTSTKPSKKDLEIFEDSEESDEEDVSEEERSKRTEDRRRLRDMASTISAGTITYDYIDFSPLNLDPPKPPVLDMAKLNQAFDQASVRIEQLARTVASTPYYSASLNKAGQDLNELLYSIKTSDLKAYQEIKERGRVVSVIPNDVSKEQRALLIGVRDAFEKMKKEFIDNCPSSRLRAGADLYSSDVDVFGTGSVHIKHRIYGIALKIGAPETSKFLLPGQGDGLFLLKNYPDSRVKEAVYVDIQERTKSIIEARFNKKIKNFFDLERSTGIENFIETVSLRFSSVINMTLSELYPKKRDVELRPCPVCYKWVPWGFSSETKIAKDSLGFTGFIYSSFKDGPDGEVLPITEEELDQSGRLWKIMPAKNFRNKDEKKFIQSLEEDDKRTGGKTWSQIQELLSSSDYASQREGWHRRASVYAALGGKQLSTVDRRIREVSFQCPFTPVSNADAKKNPSEKRMSDAQKEFFAKQRDLKKSLPDTSTQPLSGESYVPTSYCGATVTPKKSKLLSGRIAFQPQWNGIVHSTSDRDLTSTNFVNPEQWDNQDDLRVGAAQVRGGYKFSTLSFACTCRIPDPDYTSAVLHGNFVISQSGHSGTGGFVPPTRPDGQLDTSLEPGTTTFMVCAAPTSISSFDRNDENKTTFILTYLVSTKKNSPQDYYNFINYLILNGMDPQDMTTLNSDVDRYIRDEGAAQLRAESARTRSSMLKISKIITAAKSLNTPSSIRGIDPKKMLDGLYLVCPFGHRFNVGHSLRFGGAYSAVYRYSKKDVISKFPELVKLQGTQNSQALIRTGYLVEPSRMSAYENKLHYEEWMKLPEEDRIVFPEGDDYDKALLIFRIPSEDLSSTNDYVFSEKIPGSSNAAWNSNTSYDTKRVERSHLQYKHIEESQQYDKEGRPVDSAAAAAEEDIDFETSEIPEGYQLPGTDAFEKLDLEKLIKSKDKKLTRVLNQKINSLGETVKKCLAVIDSYTRGMVSRSMLNAMMIDISDIPFENIVTPDLISKISMAISGGIGGEKFLIIPTEYDDDIPNPTAERARVCGIIAREIAQNLRPRIERLNSYIKDNIFTISSQDFDRDLSIRILSGAVLEAISNNSELALPNDEVMEGREPEDVLSEAIVDSTRDIISVVTREAWLKAKESAEEKYAYGARIVYVAYAVKMARVLSSLYNKYCTPENTATYIGYDIGIDLSNPDEILGVEKDGKWVGGLSSPIFIDGIVTSVSKLKNKDRELNTLTSPTPGLNPYINRMDRFFFQLRFTLESIGNEILTPSNLAAAKEYIINRMEYVAPQARDIISVIESNMPTRTVRMSYDENAPETSLRNFHKKRIPYVSKSPQFFDSLTANKKWRVRPTSTAVAGGEARSFNTLEEAEEYLSSLPENLRASIQKVEKKNGQVVEEVVRQGYIVEEDFYYTSPAPKHGVTKIAKVNSFTTLKPADYKRMASIEEAGFSITLEGSVYYLIEVSGVNLGFTLSCKDSSGQSISIPYDSNLLEPTSSMNTYIAKIIAPEELHGVVISSGSNFIINGAVTSSNFDSSRLQVGRIKPANSTLTRWYTQEDQWALTQFGNGDPRRKEEEVEGFSDCWSFNGIMLPFDNRDHKSAKGSFASAGRVFVTSSRFIINFDGEELDISPLLIRGRSKEEVKALGRLEGELAAQDDICDYDIQEFTRDNAGDTEAITRYTQSRRAQRNKRIRELRTQIESQFQVKLNTGACYTRPTAKKNAKGLLDAEAAEYAVAPQLVNPFRAFQIINNPKLVGATISSEDQQRLKDFVIRVYNLQPAINAIEVASYKDKSLLIPDEAGTPTFNREDIFREPSNDQERQVFTKRAAIINKILLDESWQNSPGEYFDIVPGSEDAKIGSHFQFIYALSSLTEQTRAGRIKHPDVLSLINAGDQSEKFALLGAGFGQLRDTVKSKIMEYILNDGQENDAADNRNYADDIYYSEKEETNIDAPGRIMGAGDRRRLLGGVGHLGLKFDDVELD